MKNGYDPHLLYQAINITVELQYTVPMTLIYNLLLKLKLKRRDGEREPSIDEVVKLLALIGDTIQEDSSLMEIEDTEQDLQTKINQMISMIEPTLVIVLSIIVGIILFSVMLPLLGIMSGL